MRKSLSFLAPLWVLFVAGMVFSLKASGGECQNLVARVSQADYFASGGDICKAVGGECEERDKYAIVTVKKEEPEEGEALTVDCYVAYQGDRISLYHSPVARQVASSNVEELNGDDTSRASYNE